MKTKKQIEKEQAVETAAPLEVIEPEEVVVEQQTTTALKHKPTKEMRADMDFQVREMREIAGMLLFKFKKAVKNNELDFREEIQLFKEISKFIGYANDGNKIAQDVGMDSFAMKFLEINAHINQVGRQASK